MIFSEVTPRERKSGIAKGIAAFSVFFVDVLVWSVKKVIFVKIAVP